MRYSQQHKQTVRQKIIRTAGRLFRHKGYNAVSIDSLMLAAGLTRGGFYCHFSSKAELYEAALADDHDFVNRMSARPGKTTKQLAKQGLEIAQGYLSTENRNNVIRGCALASLAMDTARGPREAQLAYANVVRLLAQQFDKGLQRLCELDERSLSVIMMCIGGLLVSSATAADTELSEALSRAAKKQVQLLLGS